MTTTTNNKMNIDTIINETINTIIPTYLTKILKKNPKVLNTMLELLKKDEELHNSLKTLIEKNIPEPIIKEIVKVVRNKTSKPKDSEAPKKPKSSYLIFCQENRKRIKEKYPNLLPKEILKKLGSEWNLIKEKPESTKYIKKAVEEKTRYDTEMSEYTPSQEYTKVLEEYNEQPEKFEKKTKNKKNKNKKEKKVIDPKKPKKPQTIFFKFSKEMRDKVKEENPNFKSDEVAKELGRMWKNEVSEDEKNEYKRVFKNEMEVYKKLIESYNSGSKEVDSDEDNEKKIDIPDKISNKTIEKKTKKQTKQEKKDTKPEKKVDDNEIKIIQDNDNEIIEDSDNEIIEDSDNEIVEDSDNEIVEDSD